MPGVNFLRAKEIKLEVKIAFSRKPESRLLILVPSPPTSVITRLNFAFRLTTHSDSRPGYQNLLSGGTGLLLV